MYKQWGEKETAAETRRKEEEVKIDQGQSIRLKQPHLQERLLPINLLLNNIVDTIEYGQTVSDISS